VRLDTIDNEVYGRPALRTLENRVVGPVRAFYNRMTAHAHNLNEERKQQLLGDAVIHYVCKDDTIAYCAEKEVFDCFQDLCPHAAENVPDYCPGVPEADCSDRRYVM
jgi:hypothetical protein